MTQKNSKSFERTDLFNADQAAAYLQVNSKTLYRLIRNKGVPAFKLGREWRFKKSVLDEWLSQGMKEKPRQPKWIGELLKELKATLVQAYGRRLREVYLYGSAARGEMRRGSDFDVAVVLDPIENRWDEIQRISPLRAELSLSYGVTVSLHFMGEKEWRSGKSPLIENIRREGIAA